MSWALEFYYKQNEWSACSIGDVSDDHRQKATLIEKLLGPGSKRVLELGAGGGQVAAATAALGHTVVAIELVPTLSAHAQQLAAGQRPGQMRVIEGDFYTLTLNEVFDAVCYWDGFGIGTDAEQQALLKRIAGWLAPDGSALVEISTPWYAASVHGRGWPVGQAERQYSFDADGCRWVDTWWQQGQPEDVVQQSIRCYSPADLRLLLQTTGLQLQQIKAGGTMDWEQGRYIPAVPLEQAMQYVAQLGKS